jgi:hypothetical protein
MPTSVVSNPEVRAVGQLRCIQPLSTWAWRKGVKRRVKDQSKRLSVALPPSTGPFRVEKFGTMASSATDGSSNVSVPTKNRLPAIPCAPAECAGRSSAKLTAARRTVRTVAPLPGAHLTAASGQAKDGQGARRGRIVASVLLLPRKRALTVIRSLWAFRPGATSPHQIADALNARGVTTPRGGQWYASSVRNVLRRA